MNYANIIAASCVDFEGWSTVIQLTGCSFGCDGCFNVKAQNPSFGVPFTEETFQEVLTYAKKPFISNIVIQGGDPLHKRNFSEVITLCRRIKATLPEKDITLFTGYTYSEIVNDLLRLPILKEIDTLVDGKFVKELSPTSKPFRGSSNQVIHTLSEGLSISQS